MWLNTEKICGVLVFVLTLGALVGSQEPMDGHGYPEGKSYYRTHMNLTAVPVGIPIDTWNVYLHNNRISRLHNNAFLMLTQCRVLFLDNNLISVVDDRAFHGLISLIELHLHSNQLTTLYANEFLMLTQCRVLYLGNNSISVVEVGAFNGLGSLTELHLHTNNLATLYSNMFHNLVNCAKLDVQMNQISTIEDGSFNVLSKLRILSLSKNRLTVLTPGVFQGLNSVEEIFFTMNEIYSIDDGAFASLTKLRHLMLYGNHLEQLSSGTFTGLVSLETLNLEGNRLTSLSAAAFGHLPRPLAFALYEGTMNMTSSNNVLLCDARLCWLKQEEEAGTIRLEDMWGASTPWCSNGMNWDTWNCGLNEPDEGDTKKSATITMKNTAVTARPSSGGEDSMLWSLMLIGCVVVAVWITLITVHICLKRRGINLFTKTKSGKIPMATSRNNSHSNNHNNSPSNNSNTENEAHPAVIRVGDEIHIHNLHIDGGFVNRASTAAVVPAGGATEEYTGLDKPPIYTNVPKDECVEIDRKSKAEEYPELDQQTGSSSTDIPETGAEYAQLKRKSNDYLQLIADYAPDNLPDNPQDKQTDNSANMT